MKLDSHPLTIAQSVYDLAFGIGKVVSITLGQGFQVRFESGVEMGYNEVGVGQFPNKTLYVAAPTIIPPLNDVRDNSIRKVCLAVYDAHKDQV